MQIRRRDSSGKRPTMQTKFDAALAISIRITLLLLIIDIIINQFFNILSSAYDPNTHQQHILLREYKQAGKMRRFRHADFTYARIPGSGGWYVKTDEKDEILERLHEAREASFENKIFERSVEKYSKMIERYTEEIRTSLLDILLFSIFVSFYFTIQKYMTTKLDTRSRMTPPSPVSPGAASAKQAP